MRASSCGFIAAWIVAAHTAAAFAQTGGQTPREPLRLGPLQQEALRADPRARQLELQQSQTALRIRNLEAERLPAMTALGQAQYQSDVPTAPFLLPSGQPIFSPPKDTYDASIRVDQRLLDPAIRARLALARAELAESQARVRATLFGLRQEVNDAFFAAALLEQQRRALAATLTDLETRLRESNLKVREGTAVPADAAAVEATLLEHRQQDAELRTSRTAALVRLASLTSRPIDEADALALPDLGAAVAGARAQLPALRARPEYEQFAAKRERAARQQDVVAAEERPRLSAFTRLGYGKPGLNFIRDRFEWYALAGVELQWKAWTWGTAHREREALGLQRDVVAADEAAFTERLRRAVQTDLATIDRLKDILALDERILALREIVERTARVRLDEGVITASEYLDRSAERLRARLAHATHRVELESASARVLTTLGLEPQ